MEAGYDVRQPDKENVTLLHWAAINNRSELVKYAGAAGRSGGGGPQKCVKALFPVLS